MRILGFSAWRPLFLLSAAFMLIGGPMHPRGTMDQMLNDPQWVPSHLLTLVGFVVLYGGLAAFRRELPANTRTSRWARVAIICAALESIEMALHAASTVDHANLMAGRSTPILTTHLAMAVIVYPIFAVAIIGLIVAGMRERVLGSPWIAWLGIIGAAAHGLASPLVIVLQIPVAVLLFPTFMLFAIWMLLAAVWPAQAAERLLDRAPMAT